MNIFLNWKRFTNFMWYSLKPIQKKIFHFVLKSLQIWNETITCHSDAKNRSCFSVLRDCVKDPWFQMVLVSLFIKINWKLIFCLPRETKLLSFKSPWVFRFPPTMWQGQWVRSRIPKPDIFPVVVTGTRILLWKELKRK